MFLSLLGILTWFFCVTAIEDTWIRKPGHVFAIKNNGDKHTLAWLVKLKEYVKTHSHATSIATSIGLLNLGQISWLENHYFFVHPLYEGSQRLNVSKCTSSYHNVRLETEKFLLLHDAVDGFHIEVFRKRSKRLVEFHDPKFKNQWYLKEKYLNVSGVWKYGICGKRVTVCVIDDGIEWKNPDLISSYNSEASYDIITNDNDPSPNYNNSHSGHGTRCAGEIVAAPNNFCGVGIAYGAQISSIRILDEAVTDSMEAKAFSYRNDINDIYSCSWGPVDDGETIEGPMYLTQKAMAKGVEFGRKGYGSVYVVASGNGRTHGDNCNFDGFASSPYSITIGALNQDDFVAAFSEACASVNAVTYGEGFRNDIITTDIMGHKKSKYFSKNSGCTYHHKGTSAAAPLASAMLALMLQVNPCLSWRDLQYIIMLTATKLDHNSTNWVSNAAGILHNSLYGFGKINAWHLTNIAKVWESVPWSTTFFSENVTVQKPIPAKFKSLKSIVYINSTVMSYYGLNIVETVQVSITLSYPVRGLLLIRLMSPSRTISLIAEPRLKDKSSDGYNGWKFSSLQFWGENPIGNWTLLVTSLGNFDAGNLKSWYLVLYGTPMSSKEFLDKKLFVENSMSHNFLAENVTAPCKKPLKPLTTKVNMSIRFLNILLVIGTALTIFAAWDIIESAYCLSADKNSNESPKDQASASETTRDEEISLLET